jgi:hypothetical protein
LSFKYLRKEFDQGVVNSTSQGFLRGNRNIENKGKPKRIFEKDNIVGKLHKIRERVGKVDKGKKNEGKGDISKNLWKFSRLCQEKTGKEGFKG